MSKDGMKRFFGELEKNAVLRKKLEAVVNECHEQAHEIFMVKLIEFVKNAGFDCGAADFADLMGKRGELSDDDMRKVAGGGLDSEFARWVRDRILDVFNRKS